MKLAVYLLATATIALSTQAFAQKRFQIPDPLENLRPKEKERLTKQARHFYTAAKPAVASAAQSTVAISYRFKRIAYGTIVTTPGKSHPAILTKWSEVANSRSRLTITTSDGKQHPARVTGVYPEHDLALLTILTEDSKLPPLDLTRSATPELGHFIALARPDGNVAGLGVVSVKPRSLRESDRAYLGVAMDFGAAGKNGVPLTQVMRDSAAARAGLRNGDVITAINQTPIHGAMQMRNHLQRFVPGSKTTIRYRRGNSERNTTVHLGSRAENDNLRRVTPQRLTRMQRMGTVLSQVRTDFPSVIQSDMPIHRADAGAPVTDLNGNIVGIAIARGSRIKTFIIPANTIQQLLLTKPLTIREALTR